MNWWKEKKKMMNNKKAVKKQHLLHEHQPLPPTDDMLLDNKAAATADTAVMDHHHREDDHHHVNLNTLCEEKEEDDKDEEEKDLARGRKGDYPTAVTTATLSQSSSQSSLLSQSQLHHVHTHKPVTEGDDVLTDRMGVEAPVSQHTHTPRSGSLPFIAERLTDDDLLDSYDKCFALVNRENVSKGRPHVTPPSVLIECEDSEEEDNSDEPLHLMREKELNEESLRALIDVISDPDKWRIMQQEHHMKKQQQQQNSDMCSGNMSRGSTGSTRSLSDLNMNANHLHRHSRSKSIGSDQHEHIPPTVDMLTDSMGIQDVIPTPKVNHPAEVKHERRISLNTVCERLTEDDLDDNMAFVNYDYEKKSFSSRSSKKGLSISVVQEEEE